MEPIGLLRALFAATAGGLIGAAAWWVTVVTTGREYAVFAIAVGLLAGLAVRVTNSREERNAVTGVIAGAVALAAILGGQWAVSSHHARGLAKSWIASESAPHSAERLMTVSLVDDIIVSREAAGETIDWPTEARIDTAQHEREYPANLWAEATARRDALPEPERERLRRHVADGLAENAAALEAQARIDIFRQNFDFLGIVFMGLAALAGFGAGCRGRDDQADDDGS